MRKKRLVENILKAVTSGSLLVFISLDVSANSFYSNWYSNVSKAFKQQYQLRSNAYDNTYRPKNYAADLRNIRQVNNRVSSRLGPRASYQYQRPVKRSQYQPAVPAFARAYGWTSHVGFARQQPTFVKKVTGRDNFSSSVNQHIESSEVPVYRSAPVTTQGFRYRKQVRNANYVSFTDRIGVRKPVSLSNSYRVQPKFHQQTETASVYSAYKIPSATKGVTQHLMPVSHNLSSNNRGMSMAQPLSQPLSQSFSQPIHQSVPTAMPMQMPVTNPQRPIAPIAPAMPLNSQNKIPSSTLNNSQFQFRPDVKFVPEKQPNVVRQIRSAEQPMRLVDAKIKKTGDNFADKWTFRPVESSF